MTRMKKFQDLIEEAKRRTILYAIFVLILAYCLSLTSNSMLFNIPTAALFLVTLRYLSFELEIRKRVQALNIPSHLSHLLKYQVSLEDPLLCSPPISTRWRRKIDSPIVEDAIDDFTCHIVKEFVTDLWYSALSPDQDVPAQLRLLINDIFGEIAQRVKRINLIDLLTRDIVDLVGNHIDLLRKTKATIGVRVFDTLSSEERDKRLKLALLRTNELHPAVFSPESERKVLQQLMSGMVAIVLRPQDAQCPLMRCLARELLACAVLRPIMNFVNPGTINKLIEKAALSAKEKKKSERSVKDESESAHTVGRSRPLGTESQNSSKDTWTSNRMLHKNSEPDSLTHGKQDWAQVLEVAKQKRTRTLAPENLDNLWAKGRNYKKKELERAANLNQTDSGAVLRSSDIRSVLPSEKQDMKPTVKDSSVKHGVSKANQVLRLGDSVKSAAAESSNTLKDTRWSLELPKPEKRHDVALSNAQSSLQLGGAGSCEIKQGGLLNMDFQLVRQPSNTMADAPREHQECLAHESAQNTPYHRRTRSSSTGLESWHRLENSSANQDGNLDYWDTPALRVSTGSGHPEQLAGWLDDPAWTSGQTLSVNSAASKLNCWVVGAHLEKAASTTFAVYSIAVTDSDNNTWFVERRFRNFEQLHRNLRDLPQYSLQLPPKRFIGSSLDDSFVHDRCILLDKYLKDLLSIPSIAELHEVWDFLSVTSKNYAFSKSPSVMKTLAVNVDDAVDDMFRQLKGVSDGFLRRVGGPPSSSTSGTFPSAPGDTSKLAGLSEESSSNNTSYLERERSEHFSDDEYSRLPGVAEEGTSYLAERCHSDSELISDSISNALAQWKILEHDKNDLHFGKRIDRTGSDAISPEESTVGSEVFEDELAVPPEWIPPKLTVPLLNLVDNIFQLQDRGWIRRQVFWMAKQILQLGMGDAVDDWLVTQIQHLRREDVMSSVIKRLEEMLWPGGVFITKKNKAENVSISDDSSSKVIKQAAQQGIDQSALFESQLEASRCASVVQEILIEGGPAALVSLVGKKQYTRCAKDIYYFLQSTVFLKQLTYSVLEMLLTATFPELTRLILEIRQISCQVVT